MYVSLIRPEKLEPTELDSFLEKGWFRLGANIFTTSFLTFKDTLYDAFWLRVNLNLFSLSKSQKEIFKKSQRFKVEVKPFEITNEKRELFQDYRESLTFEPARYLENILTDSFGVFNTYDVCFYDNNRLVACGVFDLGETSAEGIVSFFAPEYKKYSFGKALVLHKIEFCKQQGMTWFYPGYVVPGYARFDYKLDIDKENSEYYDITFGEWRNTNTLNIQQQPLFQMHAALQHLESIIHSVGFEEFKLKKYRFFDISLDGDYNQYNLLTYPYIIHCFSNSGLEEVIIVYDTFQKTFKLLVCHKAFQITIPYQEDYFAEYLIKESRMVFESNNPFTFSFGLSEILKRSSVK